MKNSWELMGKGKEGAWVKRRDYERLLALRAKLEARDREMNADDEEHRARSFGVHMPESSQ